CDGCGKRGDLICSSCKSVRYWSVRTSEFHWKTTHKHDCKILAAKSEERPPTTHCTGCGLQFGGRNGKPNEICPDCGYVACDSCVSDGRRGTCYCEKKNFGRDYCGRIPEWYHYGARSGKLYRGDNHPNPDDAELHKVPASQWEKVPRRCRNCGEIKLCLIPGYR
ncbi:hypothetical protein C8R47DRAFT_1028205, partial [Mycena vitilis]